MQVAGWHPLGTVAEQTADGTWRLRVLRVTGQLLAIQCTCNHIFFHGARGRGSTEAQLIAFRRYVGVGYGSHWRGVVFDREYKNLDDLVAKGKAVYDAANEPKTLFKMRGGHGKMIELDHLNIHLPSLRDTQIIISLKNVAYK